MIEQAAKNGDQRKNPQPENKPEHPPMHYSVTEMYMIRRESISHSSDLIIKRLHRCFQRIKKFKEVRREKELNEPYEAENSKVRRDFRKIHQLYKSGSKIHQITQLKIDKMKHRVEKAKAEVNKDENILTKDLDLSRLYIKHANAERPQPTGK